MINRFSSADLALARRMEAADAENIVAWACACDGGVALPVAGGYAVFAGVDSPGTHAVGIGMNGPVTGEEFDQLEEVFKSRGTASVIDLCPMVDPSVVDHIQKRGYRVLEFNNVLARAIAGSESFSSDVSVEPAPDPIEWTLIVARGFAERDDVPEDYLRVLSSASAMGETLLAKIDGESVGGAAMGIRSGVAALYGDSTLVEARGRGVQRALIEARVARASAAGCDLAMASVVPGTASHRNYERAGFQLIYMRVNLIRNWLC